MAFTQLQTRETIGLSVETFRHWRKVLPYLRGRVGREARFSFGDLVTLAGLRCLIDEVGLSIGQLAKSGQEFFDACNRLKWIEATDAYALIRPDEAIQPARRRTEPSPVTVLVVRGNLADAIKSATIVVPLDPLANILRESLFGASLDADPRQPRLPLPPIPVMTIPRRMDRP
jgi:hypothetical protein